MIQVNNQKIIHQFELNVQLKVSDFRFNSIEFTNFNKFRGMGLR